MKEGDGKLVAIECGVEPMPELPRAGIDYEEFELTSELSVAV